MFNKHKGSPPLDLFMADMGAVGVRFNKKLDVTLHHEYGPFIHPFCRIQDRRFFDAHRPAFTE